MFERWMSRILMAKAGEGAGGGAGGGEGGDDGGDDDAKFTASFNKLFHAAIKGERKKIAKDISDEIAPSLAEMIGKGVAEAFTKHQTDLEEKAKAGGAGGGQGAGAGPGALPPDVEKRLKAAEDKAEKAEKAQKAADDARKAAEAKALRDQEHAQLIAGLTERGVRKALIGMAAKDLHERIVRDEKTNEIVFKLGDDEYDLAKGLDKYMESDAGKELLPPRDVGGSGNRGGTSDRRGAKGEMTHEQFGSKFFGNTKD